MTVSIFVNRLLAGPVFSTHSELFFKDNNSKNCQLFALALKL